MKKITSELQVTVGLALLLMTWKVVHGYDVLMVLGGMFIQNGVRYTHRSVEVIGLTSVCRKISPMPVQLHSHFAGRLRDRVMICGGNDGTYERSECYSYFANNDTWLKEPQDLLGGNLIFAAAASDLEDNFFVVGGRRYDFSKSDWVYQTQAGVFNRRSGTWSSLPDLPFGIADGCLVTLDGDLFLIGGSKSRYRYANDPSSVWLLKKEGIRSGRWTNSTIPPLRSGRMWSGCVITNLRDQMGILVSGGYYNGRFSLFLPLTNYILKRQTGSDFWDYEGTLHEERQWAPAFGLVAGRPTIASGMNYGDHSIEEMDPQTGHWRLVPDRERRLKHRREFSAAVSVPHHWFPQCLF